MEQIDDLHSYISERAGERVADRYVDRIVRYCEGFDVFPIRGASRDDILQGLRIVGFERRVTIAFMLAAEAILIEGVFYGGQDFAAKLAKS